MIPSTPAGFGFIDFLLELQREIDEADAVAKGEVPPNEGEQRSS